MTNITIVAERGESSVVEYQDGDLLKRVIIPTKFIKNLKVGIETLRLGIDDSINVSGLNWDNIQIELNNILLRKRLITIADVQARMTEFNSVILAAVGKPLLRLYQEKE